jgi:hypothetical protein
MPGFMYDIDFFGSPRVLMLRVIILKKERLFAPRRVESANQHIKKNISNTSYAANRMRGGFSAMNKGCLHEEENLHVTYMRLYFP